MTTATTTTPRSITVLGRRWFNRGPGNTYHSAEIIVDGREVYKIDFAYGYGDQYLWNARQWLSANGYLPGIKDNDNGSGQPLWDYCKSHNIEFSYSSSDVSRKRDLQQPLAPTRRAPARRSGLGGLLGTDAGGIVRRKLLGGIES